MAGYIGHFIADRFSVATTDREVIRQARLTLKPEARRDPARRDMRRSLYGEVIKAHHENRELYYQVISGRIG